MSRRDESEFPFAYLSEKPDRSKPVNPQASSPKWNSPAGGSRSMTQQIQILMLIAFATVLVFLILLYVTIMTVTADSRNENNPTVITSVTQSEASSSEATAMT